MQEVQFVALREKHVPHVRHDAFTLRKDRGHVWLQKLAIYILKKLGCELVEDRIEVKRISVDGRTFGERIAKQRSELMRHFNERAHTLLIGAEDYEQLMCTPEIYQSLTFRADNAFRFGRGEVMGLQVKVVPWMRGMVVMPND